MKAISVNEAVNFERSSDPKEFMEIGLTYKRRIQDLIEGLRKIGIKAKSKESFSYGKGVYDILLENLVNQDDEENISGYQLSYVTKEKAQEEGWDEESEGGFYWGFSLSTEDGELLIEPTLNIKSFINYFVKVLYWNLKSKIILKQRELSQLQDIESYLNSL